MKVEINKLHYPVTALGPGRRFGIWFQGCSIGCAGCLSRDTWQSGRGRSMQAGSIVERIAGIPRRELDGITISGGEPFDQPEGLFRLLSELSEWRGYDDIDLLAYSGYPLKRLQSLHPRVLQLLDAVIPGSYQRGKPTRRIWRGSANQEIVVLSALARERYADYYDYEPERPPIQVAVDESIWLIGVPREGDLPRLEQLLDANGIEMDDPSWRP